MGRLIGPPLLVPLCHWIGQVAFFLDTERRHLVTVFVGKSKRIATARRQPLHPVLQPSAQGEVAGRIEPVLLSSKRETEPKAPRIAIPPLWAGDACTGNGS